MVDAESVKRRGDALGLKPRRTTVLVGTHGKVWQMVAAEDIRSGDIWAERGLVSAVWDAEETLTFLVGRPDPKRYTLPRSTIVKIFGVRR